MADGPPGAICVTRSCAIRSLIEGPSIWVTGRKDGADWRFTKELQEGC